jgi:hypothetical protein
MDFLKNNKTEAKPSGGRAKVSWAVFRYICSRASWWLSVFSWLFIAVLAFAETSHAINQAISEATLFSSLTAAVCAIMGQSEERLAFLLFAISALFFTPMVTCA